MDCRIVSAIGNYTRICSVCFISTVGHDGDLFGWCVPRSLKSNSVTGSFPVSPENITVTFLTSTSVRISWQTYIDPAYTPIEKFDVSYKPSNAR